MTGGYTVITTMKNEGAFLLEWVAHYKALGFDNLMICTNDCADHTRRIAFRLQALGLAVHHPTRIWNATSIQRSALKQAQRYEIVAKADWIWVCDADEFLVINLGDGSVQALTQAASENAEVISIPWRVFGPKGHETYQEGRITQHFTKAKAEPATTLRAFAYAKSLFRGDLDVERIGIHLPVERTGARPFIREEAGGAPYRPQHHPMFVAADFRHAQVNHYALRSAESFLVKRDRGRVNHVGQDMGLDYWERFDHAEVECTAIRRYDGAVEHWLERLMSDPELAFMHRKSVAWHRARIAELKTRMDYIPLWQTISERVRP